MLPCVYRVQRPNRFFFVPLIQHSPFLSYSSNHLLIRHSALLGFLSILLYAYISKVCSLLASSFPNVQVSVPYRSTRQTKHYITLFLRFMPSGLHNNLLFLLRDSSAKAILHFTSWLQRMSSLTKHYRHLKTITCSSFSLAILFLSLIHI